MSIVTNRPSIQMRRSGVKFDRERRQVDFTGWPDFEPNEAFEFLHESLSSALRLAGTALTDPHEGEEQTRELILARNRFETALELASELRFRENQRIVIEDQIRKLQWALSCLEEHV